MPVAGVQDVITETGRPHAHGSPIYQISEDFAKAREHAAQARPSATTTIKNGAMGRRKRCILQYARV